MIKSIQRQFCGLFFLLLIVNSVCAQKTIYEIIERNDLTFTEVQKLADLYIADESDSIQQQKDQKHYERWKFEQKFHIDSKGYKISPLAEQEAFTKALKTSTLSSSVNWTELGPKSFTATSGWNPGVGRLTSVAVNPVNNNIIYVSSPGGGIWKTSNGGTTWIPLVDNNSAFMNIYNVCIDPSNVNTIYAAVINGGVIKSTNAGATWSNTGSGPSNTKKVIVNPTNSNIVLATSASGIHRSTNGGESWTHVFSEIAKEDIEFKPGDPSIVYASGSDYDRSTDGGVTWTWITSGITNNGRTLIGVSPNNSSVVYMVQANDNEFGRLYKSTDSGLNFTTTVIGSSGSGTNYFGYGGTLAGGQAGYDMAIAVNPSDVNDLSIAGIIVWRSTNGGTSFSQQTVWSYPNSVGYNHADVHALEYVGSTLYSGSDGGIYKTTYSTPNSWVDLSTGLGIRQLYRIASSLSNAIVMAGGAQDNGTVARQSGGNFVDWLGADGMDVIIDPNNHLQMIGTSQYGQIYRTTNGGNSRSNLTRPISANWITPLAWHPTNSSITYGGWNAIYKSTNAGTTWSAISPAYGNFNELAVAPSNDQYIYASRGSVLYKTNDGGAIWTTYTAPGTITDIAVKYNDPTKVWITTTSSSNSVMLSTNAGAAFANISAGLPGIAARSIVVDDFTTEGIYVGMNIGVYYRNLVNGTWTLFGTGLPQVAINEVELSKIGGKLRVGTYGRGFWEIDTPSCSLTLVYGDISQAGGTYSASETIVSQANIASGANYFAGKSITLNPPFSAGPTEIFTAKIVGCDNVPVSDMVAFYPFNGNANDETGNGNNGTVDGATLTADRFGNADKAYSFDGVNDKISGNVDGSLFSEHKTISLWAVISEPESYSPRIAGIGSAGTPAQYYSSILEGTASPRRIQFYSYGSVADGYSATLVQNSNEWHNYAVTFDGSKVKIFIDGVLDKETSTSETLVSLTSAILQIGYSDNNLDWFEGKIDDIRIYNRALSNAEVQALYNAEKP
jgi:photosystem II stability/assembly factor-like uncharacterized protein